MRLRMKALHPRGQSLRLARCFLALVVCQTSVRAATIRRPLHCKGPPHRCAIGTEVILKISGTPLFAQGRQVSCNDHLVLVVDKVEGDRVEVVSPDHERAGLAAA